MKEQNKESKDKLKFTDILWMTGAVIFMAASSSFILVYVVPILT